MEGREGGGGRLSQARVSSESCVLSGCVLGRLVGCGVRCACAMCCRGAGLGLTGFGASLMRQWDFWTASPCVRFRNSVRCGVRRCGGDEEQDAGSQFGPSGVMAAALRRHAAVI